MAAVEYIVLALLGAAEAGQPSLLTKSVELSVSAGEQLVRIGLVTDVPDEFILR